MRLLLPALLALAVAVLAACGEDDPVALEGNELRVRLDEYRIIPEDVRVQAGRLRIVATNVGRLTHNLKVVQEDPEDSENRDIEVGGTGTAQPGETVSFTFEDLPVGTYRMACTIANHDHLGQYGDLIAVKEGE
jgi:plastocyanin